MQGVLLYALLCATAFYLGSRAVATRWLWSRYPRWLAVVADCAACSAFYYGIGIAWIFRFDFLGLPGHAWWTPFVVGFCAVAWTPPAALAQQWALTQLGTALESGA